MTGLNKCGILAQMEMGEGELGTSCRYLQMKQSTEAENKGYSVKKLKEKSEGLGDPDTGGLRGEYEA